MQRPFPDEWDALLRRTFRLYARLPGELRRRLQQTVMVFLEEKIFEGCAGLEITDEIRVTIAAQACVLLLKLDHDYYSDLRTILVYPTAYIARENHRDGWIVRDGHQIRLGEAWQYGAVVLSWDDVLHGGEEPQDGHNVALHEFAHKLDQETGASNGTPLLKNREQYESWNRVLTNAFALLRQRSMVGTAWPLDDYGATNPAEFFSVSVEAFFELPTALREHYPELYEQLVGYFGQDPATYFESPNA